MSPGGQGSGEPLGLVEKLTRERHQIGEVKAFIGLSFSGLLQPAHADKIKPCSFGALGTNLALARAGVLQLIPTSFSAINGHINDGRLPLDTIFVQLSPPGPDGTHSLGFCSDFLIAAMGRAKLVIGEINANVPWSKMAQPLDETLIDFAIESERPVATPKAGKSNAALESIGANVADLIGEGATIQYGIGILPQAILKALSGHRNLGLHNALISEGIIELAASGALNNSRKQVNTGRSVAAFCLGGNKLRQFLHGNDEFRLYPSSYTHSPKILSQLDNLVAINSALEVDLYGQVNGEQIGEDYLGTIGGQVDFMHAASTSKKRAGDHRAALYHRFGPKSDRDKIKWSLCDDRTRRC